MIHKSPLPEDTQDTAAIQHAGLNPVKRSMNTWTGVGIGAAVVFWSTAITAVILSDHGYLSHPYVGGLLSVAVTTSVISAVIGVSMAQWRAVTRDHKCLRTGQEEVGGELAAMHHKLDRIQWLVEQPSEKQYLRAYGQLAKDLLGDDRR